jgi:cardiolipin synthase
MTQSIGHIARSHTTGIINRAFTSLVRLMFMVSHAVKDTFDLAPLLVFETDPPPPLTNGSTMDLAEWETTLTGMLGRKPESGTIDYLIDGEAFFNRFETAIEQARDSIHIRTYIFDNDDYATFIADRLRDRANAGVEVRILIDGLGSLTAPAQPASELPEGHSPPLSIHSYLESGSTVNVRSITNPFFTGDHTKSIIIDKNQAFIGGMNIAREYRYEWHDMMVELRGPVVARLQDDFNVAWAGAGPLGDVARFFAHLMPGTEATAEAGYPIRVLYTRPAASEIRQAQLAAIRRAQRYIYLQNAYLTDDTFLLELVRARRRGVDVRVVIPLESDRGQLTRDNILAANALFRHGVRVYIYPGMSHIKAAIFDGWACLGSANLDQLSLRVNLETNVATSEPAAVETLRRRLFEADFKASPEMREAFPERWNDRLWEMLGDYIF